MRILLIEDDNLIGDGLKVGLEKLGFTVDWFVDGLDGQEAITQAPYEAVVLDLALPGIDGISILTSWRKKGRKEPVLILTAQGDLQQKISGLDSGADDYLAKPFALMEVAARLRALIRRRHDVLEPSIQHDNITYYPNKKIVLLDGEEVTLAPREILLLEMLLINKNKVLSKSVIEDKLYSWDDDIQSNTVEVYVHHIRKKLGKDIIKTINKIGYIIGEK